LQIKQLANSRGRNAKNKKGAKMKDSLAMLLKTNGGKMSDFEPLAMLMRIKGLFLFSRDIDENKGC